jgi:PHD/YefM family antitoxin component YafN of YafNO toxin-antitoxin module
MGANDNNWAEEAIREFRESLRRRGQKQKDEQKPITRSESLRREAVMFALDDLETLALQLRAVLGMLRTLGDWQSLTAARDELAKLEEFSRKLRGEQSSDGYPFDKEMERKA